MVPYSSWQIENEKHESHRDYSFGNHDEFVKNSWNVIACKFMSLVCLKWLVHVWLGHIPVN